MKKNGFTLIELLATIIVLSIIALIAIPIILNVIEKTKLESIRESANGYVDAVENYAVMHEVDPVNYPYAIRGTTLKVSETSNNVSGNNGQGGTQGGNTSGEGGQGGTQGGNTSGEGGQGGTQGGNTSGEGGQGGTQGGNTSGGNGQGGTQGGNTSGGNGQGGTQGGNTSGEGGQGGTQGGNTSGGNGQGGTQGGNTSGGNGQGGTQGGNTSGTIPGLNDIIDVKGEKPMSGEIQIDEKGKVTEANLVYEDGKVECEGDNCTAAKSDLLTITYEVNGGTLNKRTDKIGKGTSTVLPIPTKEGNGFAGWYTENNGQGEKVSNQTIFNENITLYAHWVESGYTISFDAGDGTTTEISITAGNGDTIELPPAYKEGYTFNGWYTDPVGGEEVTNATILSGNITIYAHYTINSYTLTLENAKFNDDTTVKTLTYNTEVEINAVVPAGYTETEFSGISSCTSDIDVGKDRYKLKHEYSIETWNVEDTSRSTISYHIPARNSTVRANIKDTQTKLERTECYSYDASYAAGYYYCPSGYTLNSSNQCYKTTSYSATYNSGYYTCPSGTECLEKFPTLCLPSEGQSCNSYKDCSQCTSVVTYSGSTKANCNNNAPSCVGINVDCTKSGSTWYGSCAAVTTSGTYHSPYYSCPSGGSVSGSSCVSTSTTSASYQSETYSCPSGGTRNGTKCYNMRNV